MKSKLFKISKLSNHPIGVQYDYSEKQYGKFHYHKEIQITHIKNGAGILLCGTTSIQYQKGDLFIFGEELPHVFIGDKNELTENISIYFSPNWLIQLYPESNYLNHFLKVSKKGIRIKKWKKKKLIEDILNKGGLYRVSALIQLMESLSEINTSKNLINVTESISVEKQTDSEKLNEVFKYIAKNIDKPIKLQDLADITNLTPPSFCRYFKQKNGKTVGNYITEVKIESACKLLQNEDLTVEEVGYKVGYNNFSNFLRQFKKIKHQTPKEFRNKNYSNLILN